MTISIKSPTSTTGALQLNASDVLTIESDRSVDIDSGTLHVDATNNRVGIGTTSPNAKTEIVGRLALTDGGGASRYALNIESNNSGVGYTSINAYNYATSSGTNLILNESGGNVGIGTLSPGSPLTVSGISSLGVDQADYINIRGGGGTGRVETVGTNTNINLALSTKGAGAFYFWGNGYGSNALMTIDQYSNLNLGYTAQSTVNFQGMTAGAYVDVKHPSSAGSGYGYIRFFWNGSIIGQIVQNGTSAVSYNTSSDYRLKENVSPMSGSIDRLKQLKPSTWSWTQDGSHGEGFLAHEAQTVVPEAVTGTKDAMRTEEYEITPAVLDDDGNIVTEAVIGTREVPDYQGIDQSKLVPLLTAALQEAITKIEALEARVATLEGN